MKSVDSFLVWRNTGFISVNQFLIFLQRFKKATLQLLSNKVNFLNSPIIF